MSFDVEKFLEAQRIELLKEKENLCLLENIKDEENANKENISEIKQNAAQEVKNYQFYRKRKKDVDKFNDCLGKSPLIVKDKDFKNAVPSVVEPLDLNSCYDIVLEDKKPGFIGKYNSFLSNSWSSDESTGIGVLGRGATYGSLLPTLRRGEYAPPHLRRPSRLRAAPHSGLGEYDANTDRGGGFLTTSRKQLLGDNSDNLANKIPSSSSSRSTNTEQITIFDSKSVQTDIQNIDIELFVKNDRDVTSGVIPPRTATDALVDAALRRRSGSVYVDQRLTSAQNDILLRATCSGKMDKPKSILSNRRTGSGGRYNTSLDFSATSSFLDGFNYTERNDDLERERIKRETYQQELRLQIEEKRHLAALRDEQERRERDLEQRRLEQQLLRMREEEVEEDQRRQRRTELMRRHSDDLLRRKTELHELQRPWRRHADSESGNLDTYGLGTPSYVPPVTRRAPASPYSSSSYNTVPSATSVFPPPETSSSSRYHPSSRYYESPSTTSYPGSSILRKSYDTVPLPRGHIRKFDRFDSLSRIDSLSHRLETMSVKGDDLSDRRQSATQQDLSLSRSPRLRRRNSSSRFEDYSPLPVPVLKARSPVAKELRNAVPFSSDAHRRWQQVESPRSSSILTQLSSIRAQLQREQLRMDESLRRDGLMRTRTTEDY
ncbi:unnamed protein product [Ceutorhynchus assimilis]|uniref:Uncharacterized protein n=1 Tax=Ceutorhynchus assimilis TaxID=467358 RepID=A0A9P0DJG6_9CUCU|nr:unnamed protein product [Ceutorhynchus assimilis]